MNKVKYLAIMPILQLVAICFTFTVEPPHNFFFPLGSIALGILTFHLIRKLTNHDRPEWFSFLYSCFIAGALLTLPFGLWFFIYTGGESLVAIALPILIVLPLCMSFYEWHYIFYRAKKA